MVLAVAANTCEPQLRADLQRYYGIDYDHARMGEHTPWHIAALVSCLPRDCAMNRFRDKDAAWTLTDVLLATLVNMFSAKDSPKVGPTWMTHTNMLASRVMSVAELQAELSKPRQAGR